MDKETAKEILSAYRANGVDSDDPNFNQALTLCQNDPEMAKWFEEQISFDRQISEKMGSIEPPKSSKAALLATVQFEELPPKSNPLRNSLRWAIPLAAAITLISSTYLVINNQYSSPTFDPRDGIVSLANSALPLEVEGQDIEELSNWLANKGSPVPSAFPAAFSLNTETAGCRAFTSEGGSQISLYCFKMNGDLIHLFVYNRDNDSLPKIPEKEWRRKDGWNFYAWSQGEHLLALASPIDPALLEGLVVSI